MFASCGNLDNPLEELSGSGSGGGEDTPLPTSYAKLADAMDDIKDGAEIEIGYTVYGGDKDQYIAKIKKTADGFVIQEGSEFPEGLDYELKVEMDIPEEGDDAGKLVFTLTASATQAWYDAWLTEQQNQTRGTYPPLNFFVRKVMVVTFDPDPEKNTYDVVNAPGFSFKVLNVKGLSVEIEDANSKTSTIEITPYNDNSNSEGIDPLPFEIYHNGETWGEFAEKYAKLLNEGEEGDNQIISIYNESYVHMGGLVLYEFVYGKNFSRSYWYFVLDGESEPGPNDTINKEGYTADVAG